MEHLLKLNIKKPTNERVDRKGEKGGEREREREIRERSEIKKHSHVVWERLATARQSQPERKKGGGRERDREVEFERAQHDMPGEKVAVRLWCSKMSLPADAD